MFCSFLCLIIRAFVFHAWCLSLLLPVFWWIKMNIFMLLPILVNKKMNIYNTDHCAPCSLHFRKQSNNRELSTGSRQQRAPTAPQAVFYRGKIWNSAIASTASIIAGQCVPPAAQPLRHLETEKLGCWTIPTIGSITDYFRFICVYPHRPVTCSLAPLHRHKPVSYTHLTLPTNREV